MNFYATFKMIAGVKSFTLELADETTVEDAIKLVLAKHPKLRPHWLNEKKELRAHVHVFVNGQDATTLPDKLGTKLKSGEELDFIPPVAGG